MRKTKNITKRVAITILAATMMMTTVSVPMARPVTVWALNVEEGQVVQQTEADIDENRGQIGTNSEGITVAENGAALQYQDATIETNNGSVLTNYAHIGVNNGHVYSNSDGLDSTGGGEISENRGSVDGNYSSITENYGAVGFNYEAGQIDVNGRIDAEDIVGLIDISYGKVVENHGVINDNAAEPTDQNIMINGVGTLWDRGVITNASDGVIVKNSGATYNNQGTINKNTGTVISVAGPDAIVIDNEDYIKYVGNNSDGGTVELNGTSATIDVLNNRGTVTNNFGEIIFSDGGTIINQYGGSVHSNSFVTEITNYFDGDLSVNPNNRNPVTVTNNFADVTEDTDEATAEIIGANGVNQYRSVSFVAAENSSVSYSDDFTEKTLLNSNGTRGDTKYYINVTGNNGSGTITIVAEQGYKVGLNANASTNGTMQADTYGFTYELVPDGNNYKLNITGYNGNSCELSADMFGLVVSAIQNVNPDPSPNPNPRPNPNPNPNPQPSPEPQPSPANLDTPSYPSIVAVPVVQYANNERLSSTMAMPSIAMPNLANANEMHNMVSIISGTPMGGTAMLAVTGDRFDASVVAALLARRDINANIACFVNGRLSLIVIPANADLAGVIEADGSIRIARLADAFGVTEV